MENKLKIGWVGSGFVGQVAHLSNYIHVPQAEIVALAELRPKLGALACQKYGIPRYYKNHSSMLDDPDIRAVVAIVRRKHTAPVALDILNRGFHLFTEKPMAATLDQAERLVEAAERNRAIHAVGFMRRHDEGVQIAKSRIDRYQTGEELGEILFCRAYCFGGRDYCHITGFTGTDEPPPDHLIWPIAPDWMPARWHGEYDRFLNVFVHDINLIRFLFGKNPKIRHVDYHKNAGSIILDFDDFPGVMEFGHLEQNRWDEGMDIYFTRGRLRLKLPPAFLRNQPACVEIYEEKVEGPIETFYPKPDWSWAFHRQAEAFVRDVINGNQPIAGAGDGLEDMRLIEDIWKHIV